MESPILAEKIPFIRHPVTSEEALRKLPMEVVHANRVYEYVANRNCVTGMAYEGKPSSKPPAEGKPPVTIRRSIG